MRCFVTAALALGGDWVGTGHRLPPMSGWLASGITTIVTRSRQGLMARQL
jgi:hypothetical protein